MKATKQGQSIRLQSEGPTEAAALLELHGYSPRASGIMPDGSRAIDLLPGEIDSFTSSIVGSPVPHWIQREIFYALAPHDPDSNIYEN